jgi:cytochrome bd-type quinol oxidase subunit 1
VIGPYRLTVWSAPATLRTGEVHIATTLFTADGRLATSAIVQVTLTGLERQDPPLSALVYPVPGGPIGMGEAAFVVKEPGRYRVAVTVISETGEQGTMTFTVTIGRVPIFIKVMLTALLVFSLLLGLWLLRQGLRVWSRRRSAHNSGAVN